MHARTLTMIALLLLSFVLVRSAKVEVQPKDETIPAITPHHVAMTQILGLHSQLKPRSVDKWPGSVDWWPQSED